MIDNPERANRLREIKAFSYATSSKRWRNIPTPWVYWVLAVVGFGAGGVTVLFVASGLSS